ncbi:MAG: CotH kinase family protein [Sedimentisphaerales bacterium]|nr:CotH kinase family protein [Sedimentisphaerales bacterium]
MKPLLTAEKIKTVSGLLFLCILALSFTSARAEIVINEIMYHTLSELDGDDFLELYNTGPNTINLENWEVDGLKFTFGPGASIGPDSYLILAKDVNQFQTTYGFPPDHNYIGNLRNSGEPLQLIDANGFIKDEVIFDDAPPWPVTPDGMGPSLERIVIVSDGNTPRNWHASTDASGHTAGALNSVNAANLPPWISDVQYDDEPDLPVIVTAVIEDATTAQLTYIVNFGSPVVVSMFDDGLNGDGDANDGIYGAILPAQPLNTLIRCRIDATGPTGSMELPRDDDSVTYTGTVTEDDASTVTALPIYHWFMDPADYADALAHYDTDELEPALMYYNGTLYDGVQCRVRGGSSATWPKKNWKFRFPQGHHFYVPGVIGIPVDQFDMQASYADKTYMHEYLSSIVLGTSGSPYCRTFHTRLFQNGEFFGLYINMEHPDDDYFERHELDEDFGAMYKAYDGATADCRYYPVNELPDYYEKKRPDDGDFNDLHDLLDGLNNLTGQAKRDFMFDNLDIPRLLNYWAAHIVIHDNDAVGKNYYLYRDTMGTQRWYMLPWDKDLTWGRNYQGDVLNDEIWADVDEISGRTNVSPSHPLFGNQTHMKYDFLWHRMIDALFFEPDVREMYFRRLRTIMDEQLQPPGTPYEDRILERFVDEMADFMDTEAALDRDKWFAWGKYYTVEQSAQRLKDEYLEPRRTHLFTTHRVAGEIPEAQSAQPEIVINEIMYNPSDGNDFEFVELYNPSATEAVDMSEWHLDGVNLDLPPGTVLLPQSYLVVVRNDIQFRAKYGSGLFIAAQYEGGLDNGGENLILTDRYGNEVDKVRYDDDLPWDTLADAAGPSLERIDTSQNGNHAMNWRASVSTGGTPCAVNSRADTLSIVPDLWINEVLTFNNSINSDEQGEYESWIEVYNASANSIDLSGMYLTNDYNVPDKWEVPAGTTLASHDWMIFWADNEPNDGPLHVNFTLSGSGGHVGLYTSDGNNIDYLNYVPLLIDTSYGKFPDGNPGAKGRREFTIPTPEAQNYLEARAIVLNEYNATSSANYLRDNASDTFWGRIPGNGGDWFEVVVTQDHLDMRSWKFIVSDDTGGAGQQIKTLTLTNHPAWSDIRNGTIITVSEELPDNISNYDPENGQWWINVQAHNGASGTYITASDFQVSNNNWQLTVRDSNGTDRFGPAGEGIKPVTGIGNNEVFNLQENPSPFVNERANYGKCAYSTFGSPNIYTDGKTDQDMDDLQYIVDLIPPTPDPLDWIRTPVTTSSTSITMMSEPASDRSGVEYYFNNITDPNHDSGWQLRPYYKDKNLQSNTIYRYRVKTRDMSPAQNESSWSPIVSSIAPPLMEPPVVASAIKLNTYSSARTSATFSHTVPAGSNRLLVVTVMIEGGEWVDSITYAGIDLKIALDTGRPANMNSGCRVQHWYLVAPPEGTNDVSVHYASSVDPDGIAVTNFTGVNQDDPIGGISGMMAYSGTDISLEITTQDTNSVIFGATCVQGGDANPFSPGADITELWDTYTGTSTTYDMGLWGGMRSALTPGVYTFNTTPSTSDDWAIGAIEIRTAEFPVASPGLATNPDPNNGAINVDRDADLSWTADANATLHDIYFGTNPNPGEAEFKGDQLTTTYDPGTLLPNTTYYWRIDERNAGGTTTGDVWSFTTNTFVPDVVDMTQANANTAIIAAGLTVGTITPLCSDTVPAGSIISQDPNAGTTVILGTPVDLVVSTGQPLAPNVAGMSEAAAITAINAVTNISYGSSSYQCSNTVPVGNVISQSSINFVPCGTVIDLVISTGQPLVPDLTDMTEAAAIAAINAVNDVSYGSSISACSDTITPGNVSGQSAIGTVACGTVVNLYISYGQPDVPDLTGFSKSAAIAIINAIADVSYGTSTYIDSNTIPLDEVMGQSAIGTVPCGTVIDLDISAGPCTAVVPNVAGLSEVLAIAAINGTADISYGSSSYQCSNTFPVGDCIGQSIIGSVPCGTVVDLIVSSGQPSVPDVTGMSEAAAIAAINDVNDISYGSSSIDYSATVPAGDVISQSITGIAPCGTVVDLVVSDGPSPITTNGTGGGDWDANSTWAGGVVPVDTDNVIILAGDQITLVADGNCASLEMEAGSKLTMTGGGPIPGSAWSLDPASTIEFNNIVPNSWVNPTFGNLIFDLSGNYSLPESITVLGDLTILNKTIRGNGETSGTNIHYVAGNVNISALGRISAVNQTSATSASATWNIAGDVTIASGGCRVQLYESSGPHTGSAVFNIDGDLSLGDSSYIMLKSTSSTTDDYPQGTINLKGNFIQNGIVSVNGIVSGSSPGLFINFVGTEPQYWSGSGRFSISAFSANMDVNNPAGVILSSPWDISDRTSVILTNGILTTTTANKLNITNGSLIGGDASSYVNGPLGLRINLGAQNITFPVGDAAAYTPINIDFTNVYYSGTMTASSTPSMHPQIDSAGFEPGKILNRYYTIENNGGVLFTAAEVTLNFDPNDVIGGADTSKYFISKYNGSTWEMLTTANPLSTSIQAIDITSFSAFAVGQFPDRTISGHIIKFDANTPLEGVSVDATNGGGSDVTDVNGYYELTVENAWSGTVTPSLDGYTFEPNSINYSNVTYNYSAQNYVGTPPAIISNGTGGGDWHTTTTWLGGVVPNTIDNVFIQTGDEVTLAAAGSCDKLTMEAASKLTISSGDPVPGVYWSLDPTSTVEFNNTAPTSWANPVFGNLTFDLLANYSLPESVTVAGDLNILNRTIRGIGEYSGTNIHNIAGNVNISGSGRISAINQSSVTTASCTWNIGGDLNLGTTANRVQLYESAGPHSGSAVYNIDGDFTIGSSSYLMFKSTSPSALDYPEGIINLKGDLIQNGTITINSTTAGTSPGLSINFIGTSPQTWSGNGGFSISDFAVNFDVNNPAGLILGSSRLIDNKVSIILTNGILTTGANILELDIYGEVVGGSSSSYINGSLTKNFWTGLQQSYLFPIGDATTYAPVDVNFASVFYPEGITVRTTPGLHPQIATSGLDSSKTLNRYYTITNSGLQFTSATITFNFDPADVIGGADTALYGIKEYDGTWSVSTTANPLATSIQATDVTSFSDFAIGEFLWTTISGYVTEPDVNIPMEGVSVDATNNGGSYVTDANGYYELTVYERWAGTVTPTKANYTFAPDSIAYSDVVGDFNDNYIATLDTFIISGHITESNLAPLADILVMPDSNGGTFTAKYYGGGYDITDVNGYYEVIVDYNWTGDVAPSKYAYAFEPRSTAYVNVADDYNVQDYIGTLMTYRITGLIKNACDEPMADIFVDANNLSAPDTTDVNGFYEVWVDNDWSGTVMPIHPYYSFDPNIQIYTNVLADVPDQNYTATNIYDLDFDCRLTYTDISVIADNWLVAGPNVPADFIDDDILNFLDWTEFSQAW